MPNPKRARMNIYEHEIDLKDLDIKNAPKENFRKQLERIAYRGYVVEVLSDGGKIIITKPGGKFTFGTIKRDDFMVWIKNSKDNTLWLISHKNIYNDLEDKGKVNPKETVAIIDALEHVYGGEDPNDVLREVKLDSPCGLSPEVLLKSYKWIWGQEDINYPSGKGRAMSWDGIKKNKDGGWDKTGLGISDLRESLRSIINK